MADVNDLQSVRPLAAVFYLKQNKLFDLTYPDARETGAVESLAPCWFPRTKRADCSVIDTSTQM